MVKRNILAFGAHPDDIELGCSGTLRKFVKSGHDVYLCVLSEGQEAGDPKLRRKEQEEATRRLHHQDADTVRRGGGLLRVM